MSTEPAAPNNEPPKGGLIRDPNLAKNRVYIGNIPICTREELESIGLPYGNVLSVLVQKNFGFIQFENEEVANKAAAALNKSTFKGNTLTARNAASKRTQQQGGGAVNTKTGANNARAPPAAAAAMFIDQASIASKPLPDDYNHCEIVVVDRRNTKYAEYIEQRLKQVQLRVDLLFPNKDVPLGKVLSNITSRCCLYAVLVTNQHEEHQSITVNILYGQPAEHRNMPLEDAITLITNDFRQKMISDAAMNSHNLSTSSANISAVITPQLLAPDGIPLPLHERHPDSIQKLLNLLAHNMRLTCLQISCLQKYLHEMHDRQMKFELGDDADDMGKNGKVPDPEIEMQKKIMDVLQKPSVAETQYPLLYETLDAVQTDLRLMALLKDGRVQRAIDSLMECSLRTTVETAMKF